MKYTVAEFFSGCGGFSRGFARTGRFSTVFANDIKPEALKTFEVNHAENGVKPVVLQQDIRTLSLDEVENHLQSRGVAKESLDCLIGGPPCQGFSQLRRTEERDKGQIVKFRGYDKLSMDPRNDLVLRFLEVAERLKPKFILIENVPQMLNHGFEGRLGHLSETVVEILERDLGYKVSIAVLTAADYGVPQLRERAFFVASSCGAWAFPEATHGDPRSANFNASNRSPWVTVQDAIFDLPPPKSNESTTVELPTKWATCDRSQYANSMGRGDAFPHNHVTRTYSESVLRIIKEMRPGETWDAASLRLQHRYQRAISKYALTHGVAEAKARKNMVAEGKINEAFYKKYYWSAYSRLAWDAPSLTITANANFLGSGRFTHPDQQRGITVREAARLQSFDDDFKFITSADDITNTGKIGVAMDMIGEAVPPVLAKAIASSIARLLDH